MALKIQKYMVTFPIQVIRGLNKNTTHMLRSKQFTFCRDWVLLHVLVEFQFNWGLQSEASYLGLVSESESKPAQIGFPVLLQIDMDVVFITVSRHNFKRVGLVEMLKVSVSTRICNQMFQSRLRPQCLIYKSSNNYFIHTNFLNT